jgi:hypothetical protein
MPDSPFDPLTVDPSTTARILDGLGADDAPPAYAAVARVLAAASAPAQPAELRGEASAMAAFEAMGYRAQPTIASTRRSRMSSLLSRLASAKLAAAAVVGGMTLTTGLAAAGALPSNVQSAASDTLSHIGIVVPNPKTTEVHAVEETTTTTGPSTTTTEPTTSTTTKGSLTAPAAADQSGELGNHDGEHENVDANDNQKDQPEANEVDKKDEANKDEGQVEADHQAKPAGATSSHGSDSGSKGSGKSSGSGD